MNREVSFKNAREKSAFDVIVIGGGATGLGTAVDAASRGYSTLLVEQSDFAKGTSSRSTKLVHGGVRYLQQGNISLVLEALHERGILLKNAPHLVKSQPFIVPNYRWWERVFYGIGLKIYDKLSGKLSFGQSRHLSARDTSRQLPTLKPDGLRGGTLYFDGQFDDARLAISLAQTAADQDAVLLNYTKVVGLKKEEEMVSGVKLEDQISGEQYIIRGKVVVNATGVFTDDILNMDDADSSPIIAPSQGIHLVLGREFSPGNSAIMIPRTDDGRVLFAVPWNNRLIVGTTDTPVESTPVEPVAKETEIEFILEHIAKYLTKKPERDDVKSVFVGLRPLVKNGNGKKTASLSRDHTLLISESNLITITGGKWTTYRKMAQDTVDQVMQVGEFDYVPSDTENLKLHGWSKKINFEDPMHIYGSDIDNIQQIIKKSPEYGEQLHPALPVTKAEVIWAVRNEMAMTVEDVLSRRTRSLLLDAKASVSVAPEVSRLMAKEMGETENWQKKQISDYENIAGSYIL